MSKKRNKSKVNVKWGKEVPKAKVEFETLPDGTPVGFRKVDHVIGNCVYHPTKGWKTIIQYHPQLLLHKLFQRIGLQIYSEGV